MCLTRRQQWLISHLTKAGATMPADRFIHPRAGHGRKPTSLTDFEFRVWITYILAADDFGIVRDNIISFQHASEALAQKKATIVRNGIDHVVASGLVRRFEHQGQAYLYQHDWQTWQKIGYPRGTDNPLPPADSIAECDAATQELFALHPGGKGRKLPKRSGNVSETVPEHSQNDQETFSTTRAGAGANWLAANANGDRLVANGGGGVEGDELFARFTAMYPDSGRRGGPLVEQAFLAAVASVGEDELFAALENHIASEQWSIAKKVPAMDKWFRERRWLQRLDPPTAIGTNSKTAGNAEAMRQFLRKHGVN